MSANSYKPCGVCGDMPIVDTIPVDEKVGVSHLVRIACVKHTDGVPWFNRKNWAEAHWEQTAQWGGFPTSKYMLHVNVGEDQ